MSSVATHQDSGRSGSRLRSGVGLLLVFGVGGRLRGRSRGGRRSLALHAELGEGRVVELAARRDIPGELELRERALRLGAEVTVRGPAVKAELAQLFLHLGDESAV